tara:strand:+ start:76801 stop:77019 length:219 start_codon:yes stop_codon:yes gene_type:complete
MKRSIKIKLALIVAVAAAGGIIELGREMRSPAVVVPVIADPVIADPDDATPADAVGTTGRAELWPAGQPILE